MIKFKFPKIYQASRKKYYRIERYIGYWNEIKLFKAAVQWQVIDPLCLAFA